jgi:hypothetical protein
MSQKTCLRCIHLFHGFLEFGSRLFFWCEKRSALVYGEGRLFFIYAVKVPERQLVQYSPERSEQLSVFLYNL